MKTRVWWVIAVIAVGVVLAPLAVWSVRDVAWADQSRKAAAESNPSSEIPEDVRFFNSLEVGDRIRLSPAGRRIVSVLDNEMQLELGAVPLAEALQHLAEYNAINILLSEAAIHEAGLSSDVVVDSDFEDATLAAILKLLLRPNGLAYDVRDEVLVITAGDTLAQRVYTRAYHLDEEKSPQEGERLVQQIERLLMADRIDRLRQASKADKDSAQQVSTGFESPPPPPVIEIFGDRMVIAGTLADHKRIRELLRLIFGEIPATD